MIIIKSIVEESIFYYCKAIPTCCLFNRKQSHPHLFLVDFLLISVWQQWFIQEWIFFQLLVQKNLRWSAKISLQYLSKLYKERKTLLLWPEKTTGVWCFYAFIKIFYCIWVWFSKQKVNPRVLFQFFSCKGYYIPLIWPKINSTGQGWVGGTTIKNHTHGRSQK